MLSILFCTCDTLYSTMQHTLTRSGKRDKAEHACAFPGRAGESWKWCERPSVHSIIYLIHRCLETRPLHCYYRTLPNRPRKTFSLFIKTSGGWLKWIFVRHHKHQISISFREAWTSLAANIITLISNFYCWLVCGRTKSPN